MDNTLLCDLVSQHRTPFYVIDQEKFEQNLQRFKNAIAQYYQPVQVAYSFKTNYTPLLCKIAKEQGCFAEVVSGLELELASRLGFEQGRIIFNGPLKFKEEIETAIALGAIINLDALSQVETFLSLSPELIKQGKIGLRLNIDLSEKLLSKKIAKGGILPRFGLNRDEFKVAVSQLKAAGCPVISIHGHCSSSDRAAENYTAIIKEMLGAIEACQLNKIKYFDIGGGYGGVMPAIWEIHNSPTFDDYAYAINEGIKGSAWFKEHQPDFVIEPGMSVIADCVSLVTGITSIKALQDQCVVGVDANYFHVRPTLHLKPLPYRLLTMNTSSLSTELVPVKAVVGATCMERDILLSDISVPTPQTGDCILIENVGAYCSVLSPNFISKQPAILVVKQKTKECAIARTHQSFEDFFAGYSL